MELETHRATGGQVIKATLMDSSIDFTQVDAQTLRAEITFNWSAGAVAGAITAFDWGLTVLNDRQVEFTMPPVSPTPGGVPQGNYDVMFLYHPFGWSAPADRSVYLHT